MKSKKIGIVLSLFLVSIGIVLLMIGVLANLKTTIVSNIGIGVLGSSLVTFVVAIGEYSVEKTNALERYYRCVGRFLNSLFRIEYFKITEETLLLVKYYHFKNKPDDDLGLILHLKENAFDVLLDYYVNKSKMKNLFIENDFDDIQLKLIFDKWSDNAVDNIRGVRNTFLLFKKFDLQELEDNFIQLDFLFAKKAHKYIKGITIEEILSTLHTPIIEFYMKLNNHLITLNPDHNQNPPALDVIVKTISDLNTIIFEDIPDQGDNQSTYIIPFYEETTANIERLKKKSKI